MTNRFEYRSPDGSRLCAERDEEGVHIETSPYGCLVEPGHLEEVVAGLRDMARQAGGQAEPKTVQVRIQPGPREFMAMIRKAVSGEPTARALLATPCDACEHTLNWHDNQSGCTVPRCTCGRFQPAPEDPR